MRRLSLEGFRPRGLTRIGLPNSMAWLCPLLLICLVTARADAQTGGISGTVTDATTGTGLPFVEVVAYTPNETPAGTATTSGTGTYAVSGLPPGTYYLRTVTPAPLSFIDEAYDNLSCVPCSVVGSTPLSVSANTTTGNIDFALSPGASMTGTVRNGNSLGLGNVTVELYSSAGARIATTMTNGSGGYTFVGLPPGLYFARAVVPSYYILVNTAYGNVPCLDCSIVGTKPIVVAGTALVSDIDIVLQSGMSITGAVINAASSAGLNGVDVEIYSAGGTLVKSTTTDPTGRYVISGLWPGTYFAKTSVPAGSAFQNVAYGNIPCAPCAVTATTPITLVLATPTPEIDFALPIGGRVAGTVVAFGTTQSGLSVELYSSTGAFLRATLTDNFGGFQFQGLAAGTYYARTNATASGHTFADKAFFDILCPCPITDSTPIVVAAGITTRDINFNLLQGLTLSGTITDAVSSAPLGAVGVKLYSSTGAEVRSTISNAAGAYSFQGLGLGGYFLRTAVPSSLNYVDEAHDNRVCAPCNITTATPIVLSQSNVTIDFQLSRGATITGTTVDAVTGNPLPGVTIAALLPNGTPTGRSATTNSAGLYTISGLPPGTYRARTPLAPHYVSELYNNVPCAYLQCNASSGAAVVLSAGGTQSGVNFSLASDSARDLLLDFGPAWGLWSVSPWSTWQRIHELSPVATAVGDLDGNGSDDLVANFGPGLGVWAWMNHTTWTRVDPGSPSQIAIGDLDNDGNDDLLATFSGLGLWRWANGTWNRIHELTPSKLAVAHLDGTSSGDDLVIDFPGAGLWVFTNNSTWTRLNGVGPTTMVTGDRDGNGQDEVLLAFAGLGLWEYRNNSTWSRLHTLTPVRLATGRVNGTPQDDLVVEFGQGLGIWVLTGGDAWSQLTPVASQGFLLTDRDQNGQDEIIVNFGTLGVLQFLNNRTWTRLHALSPEALDAGRLR